MIITIDGPAGAGKSSVAKALAQRIGFNFLDTGAMYRAVTLVAINNGIDVHDADAVAAIAAEIHIEFDGLQVIVNGTDATEAIREPRVAAAISEVADNPDVREQMVMLQREIAAGGDYVCEGRDQGTIVFPNAECKIFLTATSTERAQRRYEQLLAKGKTTTFDKIFHEQKVRDQRDAQRPIGALIKAEDAIELISDGFTMEEVVDQIEEIARSKTSN
jgi:cytidylate kinase